MNLYEIAARYAKVLVSLAPSNEDMEKWLDDLEVLLEALNKSSSWKYFFSIPQINDKEEIEVLTKCLKGKIDEVLLNYLYFLVHKGRFNLLPEIVKNYELLVENKLSMKEVALLTAEPVNSSFKEELISKLEQSYSKKIVLKEEIHPNLIGGAILMMDNKMMDDSVQGRLKKLEAHLLAMKL